MPVTCWPGSSQSPSNSGTLVLVAQWITSEPRTTSRGLETGTISTVGGLIGIGVGLSLSWFVDKVLPWALNLPSVRRYLEVTVEYETQVTLWSIVVSFSVASIVGLVFGVYPAIIASRQDPIVALRHD